MNLDALPTIARTRELAQALATLDAVMAEDWEDRYYSFDPAWDAGEEMASMRNGSGDEWFCWLGPAGAAIVGHDHESRAAAQTEGVPDGFRAPVLEEPAFSTSDATFVIWRGHDEPGWRGGPVPPESVWLLEPLRTGDPTTYVAFAADYYEVDVDAAAVGEVYRREPLTAELVARLNPDRDPAAALAEAAALGYPTV